MNVTESRFKNRQLHMEDYLQMVSAEQKEYAEVFGYSKITEKSGVITDYWTNNLLELILRKDNLNKSYKPVKRTQWNGGIDGMQVDELFEDGCLDLRSRAFEIASSVSAHAVFCK